MNKPNITGGHVIDGAATDQYIGATGGSPSHNTTAGGTPVVDPLTFKLSRPLIEPSVIEEAKVLLDMLKNAMALYVHFDRLPEHDMVLGTDHEKPAKVRFGRGNSKFSDLRLIIMDQLINALKERLTEIGVALP